MKNKRLYTKEEDEFIIENYKSMTYKEMAKILQREEYSLQKRARKLGISKVNTNIGFTEIVLKDNDEPEVWKDIPGYEGIYMVQIMVWFYLSKGKTKMVIYEDQEF